MIYKIEIGSNVVYTSDKEVDIIDKMILKQVLQKYNTDKSAELLSKQG